MAKARLSKRLLDYLDQVAKDKETTTQTLHRVVDEHKQQKVYKPTNN